MAATTISGAEYPAAPVGVILEHTGAGFAAGTRHPEAISASVAQVGAGHARCLVGSAVSAICRAGDFAVNADPEDTTMQSRQLQTTRAMRSERVRAALVTDLARSAYLELERSLRYGTEWLWNGVDPVITAAGIRTIAEHLQGVDCAADAAALRALAESLESVRPVRAASHLPYHDDDDARLFAGHAAA